MCHSVLRDLRLVLGYWQSCSGEAVRSVACLGAGKDGVKVALIWQLCVPAVPRGSMVCLPAEEMCYTTGDLSS